MGSDFFQNPQRPGKKKRRHLTRKELKEYEKLKEIAGTLMHLQCLLEDWKNGDIE